MKALLAWFAALTALPFCGCGHISTSKRIDAADTRPTESVAPANPVPLQTPYDRDAKLRAVYLDAYARGYGLAVTNFNWAGLGCVCEAGGDPDQYEATSSGFLAGKAAGEAALATRAPVPVTRQ